MEQNQKEHEEIRQGATLFAHTYFHGTKADLKVGGFIDDGYHSNLVNQKNATYIFLTGTLDAAIWGAEPALGYGRERISPGKPAGAIEIDPDLTDQKFPGPPLNLSVLLSLSELWGR